MYLEFAYRVINCPLDNTDLFLAILIQQLLVTKTEALDIR